MRPSFFDNTTTAAPAAVASADADWIFFVLPMLGLLAFILFLLRLCYKALRDDEDRNDLNNQYQAYL